VFDVIHQVEEKHRFRPFYFSIFSLVLISIEKVYRILGTVLKRADNTTRSGVCFAELRVAKSDLNSLTILSSQSIACSIRISSNSGSIGGTKKGAGDERECSFSLPDPARHRALFRSSSADREILPLTN